MSSDGWGVPHKVHTRVEKYHDGNTEREPDEIVTVESWHDADGSMITDPDRIAELEARIARPLTETEQEP